MLNQPPITRRTAIAALATAVVAGAINTREPAPRFRARSLSGRSYDNASLKGKPVLLQFWTTWCQYCKRDEPAVEAIVHDFAGKGLVVLAVNVGEPKKKVQQYLEHSPRLSEIVLTEDTNLAAFFAAKSYPLYVLIDKDGNIVADQKGSGGEAALRQLLRKVGLASD